LSVVSVLRSPLVLFAFAVDKLRRVPGVGLLLRHAGLAAGSLLVGAVLAFAVWTATVAPQRVNLADLVQGRLSIMQTWIIITGDLAPGTTRIANFAYVMTDPAVPNARMNVYSEVELPVGRTTVSGSFGGPREPNPVGYAWVGSMRADQAVAPELGLPWISIVLIAAAAFLVLAPRVSYPMFEPQTPARLTPRPGAINVGVRDGVITSTSSVERGALHVRPGESVTLQIGDVTQSLRLHSAHSGVDVGRLRQIGRSEPALRVRLSNAEVTLTFDSSTDRDTALAALRADAVGWSSTTVASGAATTG
jgi:hypothetical protein